MMTLRGVQRPQTTQGGHTGVSESMGGQWEAYWSGQGTWRASDVQRRWGGRYGDTLSCLLGEGLGVGGKGWCVPNDVTRPP